MPAGCASSPRPGCCGRALCRPNRSARCATSRAIARRRFRSARARPTGCTRRSRTPASSSTASLSDLLGVSGRAMLDALVNGTTDPALLADLARGRMRSKLPALREALEGRFDRMHALWIGSILAHVDFLDEQIANLTEAIAEQIAPFEQAVELLVTITGVQRRTAEVIVAEIGVDMSVFP